MIRINLQFFGGRGATSSRRGGGKGTTPSAEDSDVLGIGKKGIPKSVEYAMSNTNPNFNNPNAEAEGWHHNCQSCAMTFEAMMRGYDTEAVPHKKGDPYFVANGKEHKWRDCFEGKQTIITVGYDEFEKARNSGDWTKASRLANKIGKIRAIEGQTVAVNNKTAVNKQMKEWGDGSRATLTVIWKNGGGHIINVINKGGKALAIDAQSNQIKDLGDVLSRARTNYTALTRVDNLKFTSDVQYLTKGK